MEGFSNPKEHVYQIPIMSQNVDFEKPKILIECSFSSKKSDSVLTGPSLVGLKLPHRLNVGVLKLKSPRSRV